MAVRRSAARLRFNTGIYKKEALRKAVTAYSSFAEFSLKDGKGYIEIEVCNVVPQARGKLADEFANYALGMVKKCL